MSGDKTDAPGHDYAPGHGHGHGHGHGPVGDAKAELGLTLMAIGGLAVALVDAYVLPVPVPVPLPFLATALTLSYLAGGLPLCLRAMGALFRHGRAGIDLLMALAALAALGVGAAMEGRRWRGRCCWRCSAHRGCWNTAPWAGPGRRWRD